MIHDRQELPSYRPEVADPQASCWWILIPDNGLYPCAVGGDPLRGFLRHNTEGVPIEDSAAERRGPTPVVRVQTSPTRSRVFQIISQSELTDELVDEPECVRGPFMAECMADTGGRFPQFGIRLQCLAYFVSADTSRIECQNSWIRRSLITLPMHTHGLDLRPLSESWITH